MMPIRSSKIKLTKLKSGEVHRGPICVTAGDTPVEIRSDAQEPATIDAGDGPGIVICDRGEVRICNLRIIGTGREHNQACGIRIEASAERQYHNILVDRLDVSGFGEHGLLIHSTAGNSGFKNIRVTNVVSHHNGRSGITIGTDAYPATPHEDVYVGRCAAYWNPGIPGQKTHTGSGIAIDGFRRGTIEYCEAYENGALCDATESGGPVGIWAYNCDRALLQFNRSHHNHSNNQADGGGFDLDGGTTNSVMRYNVSWENDGYGFQLWDFFWGEFRNNRVHHNVSLMDCQRWRNFGAFVIFGRVINGELYHNVAYLSADSPAVEIERWDGTGLRFSENVYLGTGNSQPFSITESPGVGLESSGENFRRETGTLDPEIPNILKAADFRDVYRHARQGSGSNAQWSLGTPTSRKKSSSPA